MKTLFTNLLPSLKVEPLSFDGETEILLEKDASPSLATHGR